MISLDEALQIVLGQARPLDPVNVSLDEALGLVLAEDVLSDIDMPPFNKSAMDGFAVIAEETAAAPVRLRVIEDIQAGSMPKEKVTRGTASRIMTGAAVPEGADAVVMKEKTRLAGEFVEILEPIAKGKNICFKGEDIREGAIVLGRGTLLRPAEIGVLASVGRTAVRVHRRPDMAVLATGDELVPPESKPSPVQIRDSNSYSLSAQGRKHGAAVVRLGIATDETEPLRARIREGLKADLFIISGGVSEGEYDMVRRVLLDEGVQIHFDRVRIKPGKPTVFGTWRNGEVLVFGLPGNPTSTLVTFELLVAPALRRMMGVREAEPRLIRGILEGDSLRRSERRQFLPGVAEFRSHGCCARAVEWHGAADLAGASRANALLVVPEGEGKLNVGDAIDLLML